MKILLHGATGFSTTNFGDCLFSVLFYENASRHGSTQFWDLSPFMEDKIPDLTINIKKFHADVLVYISGGYFADPYKKSLKYNLLNLYKYYTVGILYSLLRKPIAIIGVDVDRSKYKINEKLFKFIFKRSYVVAVRNGESVKAIKDMGLALDKVHLISDTAQTIVGKSITPSSAVVKLQSIRKKKLLWHFNHLSSVFYREYEAINKFLNENNDYCLVITDDCICSENLPDRIKDKDIFSIIKCETLFFYKYTDPLDMCALIDSCDMVLTYKLHVGIVASAYHKSVVAISQYYEKVSKYYRQIGEPLRCRPLSEISSEALYDLLIQYKDTPVTMPQNIFEKAQRGFSLLDGFLNVQADKK